MWEWPDQRFIKVVCPKEDGWGTLIQDWAYRGSFSEADRSAHACWVTGGRPLLTNLIVPCFRCCLFDSRQRSAGTGHGQADLGLLSGSLNPVWGTVRWAHYFTSSLIFITIVFTIYSMHLKPRLWGEIAFILFIYIAYIRQRLNDGKGGRTSYIIYTFNYNVNSHMYI